VEDIDLGYRLTERGYTVAVEPALAACHLKRWTLGSAIVSDVRDRGIPWTQLMLRYGVRSDHLNVSARHRWSVVFAYLALGSLLLTAYDLRFAAGAAGSVAAVVLLNAGYYGFLYRARGAWFAARACPVHILHHLCNGVSFAAGVALFLARRHLGFDSMHALPGDSWTS
jgi:hypothetical protein